MSDVSKLQDLVRDKTPRSSVLCTVIDKDKRYAKVLIGCEDKQTYNIVELRRLAEINANVVGARFIMEDYDLGYARITLFRYAG